MILFGKTDIGRVRPSNQDNFALRTFEGGKYFAIVCDGMGGYAGGNVASEIAINTSVETIEEMIPISDIEGALKNALDPFEKAYAASTDSALKVNIAEYLKNIYYRFFSDGAEYEAGYNKYNEVVKTGKPL